MYRTYKPSLRRILTVFGNIMFVWCLEALSHLCRSVWPAQEPDEELEITTAQTLNQADVLSPTSANTNTRRANHLRTSSQTTPLASWGEAGTSEGEQASTQDRASAAAGRGANRSGSSHDLSTRDSNSHATADTEGQACEPERAQAFDANQGSHASDREIVSATAATIPEVPDRSAEELVWYTDSGLREGFYHCRQLCHRLHIARRVYTRTLRYAQQAGRRCCQFCRPDG